LIAAITFLILFCLNQSSNFFQLVEVSYVVRHNAGWEIEFRLPRSLLIENILMKLKLMRNIVCSARTKAPMLAGGPLGYFIVGL
jgi:hypothetical protein